MSAQPLASVPKPNNRLDLTGLEELFEQQLEPHLARGLSLKEAVFFYGLTKKQLRRQIKDFSIPAIKVTKKGRKKWLVYPSGIPQELEDLSSAQNTAESEIESELPPVEAPQPQIQNVEAFRQTFMQLPRQTALVDTTQILDFSPDSNDPFLLSGSQDEIKLFPPGFFAPEEGHISRIVELEQQLSKAQHKNDYLETRIAGLEDQVKFLIQCQYNKPAFNRLAFILPVLIALSAVIAACFPALLGS